MGLERYVVDAVLLEKLSIRDVAKRSGVSKSWIHKLVQRFREGGYDALDPKSKRPNSCSHAAKPDIQAAIVHLRTELGNQGLDNGPHTIHYHLCLTHVDVPSVATIWRILKRHGLITPQAQKRPKSSFIRFQADLPNEMWQSDFTHWELADGTGVEILNFLDDHSRLLLACDVFYTVKGLDVVRTFQTAGETYGLPASLLTDNGAVFTSRSRKGKGFLESELERLGIVYKNSRPYHPQTCGKVERFHQTLKKYLDKQPRAHSLPQLQLQLDTFRSYYNHHRPHRALNKNTPLYAFNARIKAKPAGLDAPTHFRVRHDKVSADGKVTLRYLGKLFHIGVGRAHKHQPITLLIANKHIRILDEGGLLIRELILDPSRNYQPLENPKIVHDVVRQVSAMS